MTTSTAEIAPAALARAPWTDRGVDRTTTGTRPTHENPTEEDSISTRYFLAQANGDRITPALDREVTIEGEALVEALCSGVT
jgi:hypothetical protein